MRQSIRTFIVVTALFVVLFAGQSLAAGISDVKRITVDELVQLQTSEKVVVIDTRAPSQWLRAKDKIPGAIRLPSFDALDTFKTEVATDQAIVTYCT